MRIGFVTALADEARTLTVSGNVGDPRHEHLVEIAGLGIENAAQATRRLLDRGIEGLVSWGTAAALDPRHQPGSLIVYDAAIAAPGTRHECDETWRAALARSLRALDPAVETGFTAPGPIAAAVEKAAIRDRFNCAALDMESAAVGECAGAAGVPFVVLRAIVDPADFDIPRAALRALEHGGQPRAWPVAWALMRRPHELPALLKLSRWYRLSLARLRLAAHSLHPSFGMD